MKWDASIYTEINFHNLDNNILQDMVKNYITMKYFNGIHVTKEHEKRFFNTKWTLKIIILGLAAEN